MGLKLSQPQFAVLASFDPSVPPFFDKCVLIENTHHRIALFIHLFELFYAPAKITGVINGTEMQINGQRGFNNEKLMCQY